jgi:hypothetical protein
VTPVQGPGGRVTVLFALAFVGSVLSTVTGALINERNWVMGALIGSLAAAVLGVVTALQSRSAEAAQGPRPKHSRDAPRNNRRVFALVGFVLALLLTSTTAVMLIRGQPSGIHVLRGLVGSEKESFFEDPGVRQILLDNDLMLDNTYLGSVTMADDSQLGDYDFAFPGSPYLAEQITKARPGTSQDIFTSPLVVASHSSVVKLLQKAGLASSPASGPCQLDLRRYLEKVNAGLTWGQVGGTGPLQPAQAVLIATTSPEQSNSATMFTFAAVAVLSTGANPLQEDAVIEAVAAAFGKQGASKKSTTDELFREYKSLGPRVPLALVYEAEFARWMQTEGSRATDQPDMLYFAPGVDSVHSLVTFSRKGNPLPRWLGGDPVEDLAKLLRTDGRLRQLARVHGFRTGDGQQFVSQFSKVYSCGRALPPVPPPPLNIPTPADRDRLLDRIAAHSN